jgi:hypothetical protein
MMYVVVALPNVPRFARTMGDLGLIPSPAGAMAAGIATSRAIIATTTSTSISVNPSLRDMDRDTGHPLHVPTPRRKPICHRLSRPPRRFESPDLSQDGVFAAMLRK